jgi:hypothetical protein
MEDSSKEAVPLPAYDFNPNDTVILLVGPEARKMLVHGLQITAHSDFFAAALKKEWAEGQTRKIKLPEEEPEIMPYYFDHVYFGKLPTEIYTTASLGLKKELGYKLLAQLYVLAERMLDSKCRNRILREFLRLRDLKCTTGETWNPTEIPVNIIYQGTTSGSPARRLLVDIHASYARENWYPEDVNVAPAFLLDLLRKLLHDVEAFKTVGEFRRVDLEAEGYRI